MIYKLLLILAIFLSVTQWDSVAFPPSEETDNPTSNPHPVAIPALNREERSDCPAGSLQMQTQQEPTNNAAMDLLAKACEERLAEDNYQRAVLRVQNRTQDLTDAEATRILVQISLNLQAPAWMRTKAAYYQGYMRVQNRTEDLTDDAVMGLLAQISQNLQASASRRIEADYSRAYMRVQHRTDALTDAAAMNVLSQVHKNPKASERLRAEAGYYQAVLCVQNRTEAITDKDAMNILTSVSQNLQVSSQIRDKAKALLETSFQNAPQTNNKKRKRG